MRRGSTSVSLLQAYAQLVQRLQTQHFAAPVTHVYQPLAYAWTPFADYCQRFGQGAKEILLLGMNPGPFGMVQTGIPFGAVPVVRDWLRLPPPSQTPSLQHPQRRVSGFACQRVEVSGQRLWGWAQQRCKTPEHFFQRFFVANYCPLAFMEASGKNRTPDKLPVAERQALFAACNATLRQIVQILQPRYVIGVGAFAATQAAAALAGLPLQLGRILHPSPSNPRANRGWAQLIEVELQQQGVLV